MSLYTDLRISERGYPAAGIRGVFLVSGGSVVSKAMTMSGVTVGSGQNQYVYSRGIALRSIVSSGGFLRLSSATASAVEATVESGGTAYVVPGAVLASATLRGGVVNNSGSAPAFSATAGTFNVFSGADVPNMTLEGTVSCYLRESGIVINDPFISGMAKFFTASGCVVSGGSAVGNNAPSGVILYTYGGAVVSDFTVTDVAQLRVSSGGSAVHPVVGSRGQLIVYGGGTAVNASADAGGIDVNADGVLSGSLLGSDALQKVWGSAVGVTVESGASLYVYSGGTALAVTSNAGAVVSVYAGGSIEYAGA